MISDKKTIYPAIYKKMRIFSRFFIGRPVWCTWQVTYRCNFNCSFCDYWKCKVEPSEELSLRDIEKGSRNLARISSLMISIGGGEPFMRPDLPQIIEIMARYHMPLLTTNGWCVTREFARRAFRAGLWGASVSIDYADEKKHDHARGVEGAYQRALKALEYFSQERCGRFQRVNVMGVLMRDNVDEIEPLIKLAAKHGAYFMVQPYCSLKGGENKFAPDRDVAQHLLSLRERYDNFISNEYFLERFDLALDGGIPGCRAGQAFFNIDNFGRVAKCVENLEHPLGNIVSDPPQELRVRLRSAWRENTCRSCWYNCRGEIESLYSPRGFLKAMPVVLSTWARTKRQ
ncbi:MAG: radical SAM protein [Candidatus Aureabacteria bacterium]|nr:radical SAM protein [Candidatus Auribacterota bacterium]